MGIFKAYDIRGKYPDELDDKKSYLIGRAIAKHLKINKIAVGRDVRISSDSVRDALVKGLVEEGVAVTDIGVVTTPMSYFASGFYNFPATVMVTASHNPPEYNGFKICREKAIALSEQTGLLDIKRLVGEFTSSHVLEPSSNQIANLEIKEDYRKFILGLLKDIKPFRVVVDTANGSVGPIFKHIFEKTPFTFIPLYFQPDGRFPNHEPNPMKDENLKEIKRVILKEQADFGVAFDGDGDRCVFLDEKAQRIPSDLVSALIAREAIAQGAGAAIVYDLRSSWVVRDEITKAGGKPIRERVGHAFIKKTMREHNAPFGGELSGHYYFRENYFADSGIVAFVHFINAVYGELSRTVSRLGKSVSEIINPLRRYFASGEINFEVASRRLGSGRSEQSIGADKDATIKEIARQFKDGKQDWLDGITVEYPDYWFNVRPSNTEPLLRLNLEAKTQKRLDKAKEKLIQIIKSS